MLDYLVGVWGRVTTWFTDWWSKAQTAFYFFWGSLYVLIVDWSSEWMNLGKTLIAAVQEVVGERYWRIRTIFVDKWNWMWGLIVDWTSHWDIVGTNIWDAIWKIVIEQYWRLRTIVIDRWARLIEVLNTYFNLALETGITAWESIREVCIAWYWKVRALVVDGWEKLVWLIAYGFSNLVNFISDPAIFIYTWLTEKANYLTTTYKAQMQSTGEHILRFLWEGVW